MRTLLRREPAVTVSSLDEVLAIAAALEAEALRRYDQLARLMRSRGLPATAAVFTALAAEESDHAGAVAAWAARLGLPPPDGDGFAWVLPADIAESWAELAERTHITPYQALSVAVLNETRAFAFYSYLAATAGDAAGDAEVRRQAERLALEELGHAAALRRERRRAFHRQRAAAGQRKEPVSVAASAGRTAHQHVACGDALDRAGDAVSAALLRGLAADLARLAGCPPDPAAAPVAAAGTAPALLRLALAASDSLAETMGDAAPLAVDESELAQVLTAQEMAVRHLARIATRLAERAGPE